MPPPPQPPMADCKKEHLNQQMLPSGAIIGVGVGRKAKKQVDKSQHKPYSCMMCQFSARQKNDLKKHVDTVHYGIKMFGCDICSYQVSRSKRSFFISYKKIKSLK